MKKVVLVNGDILTPLGNLEVTWKNLLDLKSALAMRKIGAMEQKLPVAAIENLPGTIGSWNRLEALLEHIMAQIPSLPEKTKLFCATTKGAVDELIQSPTNAKGQPWQVAEYLSHRLGLTDPGTTVSAACASGLIAVIQGAMNITSGKCEHALVIGFDLLAEFIVSGFESLKALSHQGAKPFDRKRNGLSLGDGAGWLLLSAEDSVEKTSQPLAYLEKWSITCDATHITAPCRHASGLKAALAQVSSGAKFSIGGINAHGTGTVYNDAMELLAFAESFDTVLPVCSVKGALGHSLAAAGLVETLLSVESLKQMMLPPTVGLQTPEKSNSILTGKEPLPLKHPAIITCNSGFGGINAALLMTG